MPRRSTFLRYDAENDRVVEVKKTVTKLRPHYPLECEALAVHPEQIGEAIEFDCANGVPTEYAEDGSPIMRDASHYKRYRRAHGYHFRNCYDD